MKLRYKLIMAVAAVAFLVAGCGKQAKASETQTKTVKVGIVGADQQIWQAVAKKVKKEGIIIKPVQFQDDRADVALNDGDIGLNAFQHYYFLSIWNKSHHADLQPIGNTLIAPQLVYSKKVKSLQDLKPGATISIPNDATNEGRALKVLVSAHLITLDNKKLPTIHDIKSNKLHLKIKELETAQLPKTLDDVSASVISSGVAVDAGLNPKDAIYREKVTKAYKPWVNIIVAQKKDKNNPTYKKIVKAYQSPEIKKVIKKVYKGAVLPAWDYKF
ncbi:MetQ/NlpA family ABC transporter substrate-binding protein [Lacticaseibacillus camelliae]|uniref:Lipoprotein n=1 Tax=Lacticaseibacillus camelliae DSM 22697 = JCM 13995 TaxID=1423730 RepID=A0A0R2F270_9LACO|nr:MetQ/NlpA family ABC transporter substrate-binding protein [Lacticaseibacillus camelliae]KRN21547.1 Outer membrane lipoprotein [Lacticaseibacillus camelliae DSM 22697 = JCM 13995]